MVHAEAVKSYIREILDDVHKQQPGVVRRYRRVLAKPTARAVPHTRLVQHAGVARPSITLRLAPVADGRLAARPPMNS